MEQIDKNKQFWFIIFSSLQFEHCMTNNGNFWNRVLKTFFSKLKYKLKLEFLGKVLSLTLIIYCLYCFLHQKRSRAPKRTHSHTLRYCGSVTFSSRCKRYICAIVCCKCNQELSVKLFTPVTSDSVFHNGCIPDSILQHLQTIVLSYFNICFFIDVTFYTVT